MRQLRQIHEHTGLFVLSGAAEDQEFIHHLREPVHLGDSGIETVDTRIPGVGFLANLLELEA